MKKRFAFLLLFVALSFAACSTEEEVAQVDRAHFEAYRYHTVELAGLLDELAGNVVGTSLTDDLLRVYAVKYMRELIIIDVLLDGTGTQQRTLELNFSHAFYWAEQVLEHPNGRVLYVVGTAEGTFLHQLDAQTGEELVQAISLSPHFSQLTIMPDGRIAGVATGRIAGNEYTVFQIIDEETGEGLEIIQTSLPPVVVQVHAASVCEEFDLLMSVDGYLLAYHIETGGRKVLFRWLETEGATQSISVFLEQQGDQFFLVQSSLGLAENEIVAQILILSPSMREETERITLTLGGVYIYSAFHRAVRAFNQESETHEIVIRDYGSLYGERATARLHMDLITGNAPDILTMTTFEMLNGGFLLDLYPLLDADLELSRADFLPNVLGAMQGPSGGLYEVTDQFMVRTMFGLEGRLAPYLPWTTASFLRVVEGALDLARPLGLWWDLSVLITLAGDAYVDWHTRTAYLDTQEFIDLLELARLLPAAEDMDWHAEALDDAPESVHLREGAQLLVFDAPIMGVDRYLYFAQSAGDIAFVGIPTAAGGVHGIQIHVDRLSINAVTEHVDAAWEFVRQMLLPGGLMGETELYAESQFPVRLDEFERLMEFWMTPRLDAVGEEIPLQELWITGDQQLRLYAICEDTALEIREFIESSRTMSGFSQEVVLIIQEETLPFFAGDRSAADTARIIQNRVQTYLNELR